MRIRAILAGGLIAVAAVAIAQDVPVARKDRPPDIVVTGDVPQIQDGLWRVRRWPGRSVSSAPDGPSEGQTVWFVRGGTRDLCVADGRANQTFVELLDDEDRSFGCSRLRLRLERGRLRGGMTCRRMTEGGQLTTTAHYRGAMTLQRINVRVETRNRQDGLDLSESTMRLEANRIGECAPPARAVVLPPAGKTIPPLAPPPPAQTLSEDLPPTSVPPLPGATMPAVASPAVAESANDIVVVARRLRRLRLKYATSGRILRWCRPAISSGDRRVDQAGCAIVRACVRAGFGDPGPDIACFRRTVDSLEADIPPPTP